VEDVKTGKPFSLNIDRGEEKSGTYWVEAIYAPLNDCHGLAKDTF
jgi:hypothetical protein